MNKIHLDIAHNALQILKENSGIEGEIVSYDHFNCDKQYDAQLELNFNNIRLRVLCEIKREFLPHHLYSFKDDRESKIPVVVIAGSISLKIKEQLRAKQIGYLDGSGNFFLNTDNLFVWIDGRKSLVNSTKRFGEKAFTKTGLKIAAYFIMDGSIINLPYRQIAEMTNSSLGNVNNVINSLWELGYIPLKVRGKMRINERKKLLEKWIYSYSKKLKPSLFIGSFRFADSSKMLNWSSLKLKNGATCWGGEPAADILTKYLKPEEFTLYTDENRVELMKNYHLIPDPEGKIKIYNRFWSEKYQARENVAPPLIIYADLMNTEDNRCIELAEKINNEYLSR